MPLRLYDGKTSMNGRVYAVDGGGYSVNALFESIFSNSLLKASMTVELWEGSTHYGRGGTYQKPILSREYSFDKTSDGLTGWREEFEDRRLRSSAMLAEDLMNHLFAAIESGS